ncbi:MAG: serine hydrolase [Alphaproteobacteria bacterium]|nr:serine hydrolase [Alphaproteobacteria bacterium]
MNNAPSFTTYPSGPTRRSAILGTAAAALMPTSLYISRARATTVPQLDAMAKRGLSLFDTPALSLAIVENGTPAVTRGYGVERQGSSALVSDSTLFPIASLTKGFTSAAIAVLVADGKLNWGDKVSDRLPNFQLYDPVATREMNIKDLLSHRSGLGVGEGDLMLFPPTTFTRPEVVSSLRYLKPADEFRNAFNYDNVLYIAAGELIGHVSGQPWETFVRDRILVPAGMNDSVTSARMASRGDQVSLHARIAGPVRGLGPVQPLPAPAETDLTNPAGGIRASARDMAEWMGLQLAGGALPDGRRLWSQDSADTMWRPLAVVDVSPGAVDPATDPHFVLSAPGWAVLDYRGVPVVMHSGQEPGMCSRLMLVPSRKFGLYIALNSEEETLHEAFAYSILDAQLGLPSKDYFAEGKARDEARRARMRKRAETATLVRPIGATPPPLPLSAYVATYRSDWYGDVIVKQLRGSLMIDFSRTPAMKGPLVPWNGQTFLTQFPDRDVENALVTFEQAAGREITAAKLQRASPAADPSYDYQDLGLHRVR